jgi:hypothetical protein
MRFQTVCDTLGFGWDEVVTAFWARYPNPYTRHVLTEDVLKRELREDGTLYTCRLLMKTDSLPSWARNLMPARSVPIIEESIVDPQNKTFTTYCRNVTYKNIMETTEKVVYTNGVDLDGKSITNCDKKCWISSPWFFPTRNLIEKISAQRWVKYMAKSRNGFNHVLEQIYSLDALNSVFPVHPFILEKRKILKEKAALMGCKAKKRLGNPIEHAKEKLEKTRENAKVTIEKTRESAKVTIEKTRENAKVTIEKTRENAKVTIGSAQDNLKEKFSFRGAEG